MEWSDGGGEWGVRGREELGRGEGVKCAHCLGACMVVAHMVMGAYRVWARMGRGCVSCMGAYGSWACMGRGRVWVMGGVVVGRGRSLCVGEGLSCPWALVIHGGGLLSSMGGALSSMQDGRLWLVGRGVVVVPGHCL